MLCRRGQCTELEDHKAKLERRKAFYTKQLKAFEKHGFFHKNSDQVKVHIDASEALINASKGPLNLLKRVIHHQKSSDSSTTAAPKSAASAPSTPAKASQDDEATKGAENAD